MECDGTIFIHIVFLVEIGVMKTGQNKADSSATVNKMSLEEKPWNKWNLTQSADLFWTTNDT